MSTREMKVWECKVVIYDGTELPDGADLPMRKAVRAAVNELLGRDEDVLFSGWGGKLTEGEAREVERGVSLPEPKP